MPVHSIIQRSNRLARYAPVLVRRDAAQRLTNGRVVYDALMSRVGLQAYGDSIEYRPPDEVFSAKSLASGGLCPGVLFHPADNYGTSFGEGSYPVRGATGEFIQQHSDGVHTYGRLAVWDDEWNGLIESVDVTELSVGYTIAPDYTAGTVPSSTPGADEYGTAYQVVHRDIVWDHVAGVPAGNAGSARVVLDGKLGGEAATRRALADIAAMRQDARPLYFTPGQWPARTQEDTPMTNTIKFNNDLAGLVASKLAPRKINDAMIKIYGESDDPVIVAALAELATAAVGDEDEPDKVDGEDEQDEQDPDAEDKDEPEADAEDEPEADAELGEDDKGEDEDPPAKMDAKTRAIHDAACVRAHALLSACEVFGREYATRADTASKSNCAIMVDVIREVTPARVAKLDKHTGPRRLAAVEVYFDAAVDVLAERADHCAQLLETVRKIRDARAEDKTDTRPGALHNMHAKTAQR